MELLFLNHWIPATELVEKRTLSPEQNVVAPVAVNSAVSWLITRTVLVMLSEQPVDDVATNFTEYVPGAEYERLLLVFVPVVPFPKFQFNETVPEPTVVVLFI